MSERDSPAAMSSVLWRFAPMVYGPTLLFAIGEGAVLPVLPVIATRLGADISLAALVGAALIVGQLCGNIPAGWAVSRVGERLTMAAGGVLALAGTGLAAVADGIPLLMLAVFLIGFCASAFALARHAFMTTRVPLHFRARALSLLGGTFRAGMFAGPFLAAALIALFGDEHATLWFFGVCLAGTVLLVLLGPDPEAVPTRVIHTAAEPAAPASPPTGVFRTMWRHRSLLARMGLAAAALAAVRSARQVVLPLWGVSIGMDAGAIALVVGISGAIDFALFYASGQVMDRFGRLWAALPAMLLMGAGFFALSVTHDLTTAVTWFTACACVIGVGNGLSSGILLTLGADLAPPRNPAAFLGSWRTLTDGGGAAAPLVVSGLSAAFSLSIATAAMGVVGLLGAVAFLYWVPRFVPRR